MSLGECSRVRVCELIRFGAVRFGSGALPYTDQHESEKGKDGHRQRHLRKASVGLSILVE